MKIERITLSYHEKRSEEYQTAEHGATVEIAFDQSEMVESVAEAMVFVQEEHNALVDRVAELVRFEIGRIQQERGNNGPRR